MFSHIVLCCFKALRNQHNLRRQRAILGKQRDLLGQPEGDMLMLNFTLKIIIHHISK